MKELSDAVRHLLMSFPDEGREHRGPSAAEGLVLRAMVDLLTKGARNPLNIEEIVRHLHACTDLAFDSEEVHAVLRRLQEQNKVAFTDRDEYSVALDPSAEREARAQAARRQELDDRVREAWFTQYLEGDDSIEFDHAEAVWTGLKEALARLINARAAEAAAFLYIDRSDARVRFEGILNEARSIATGQTIDQETAAEVHDELVRFISTPNDDKTEYLVGMLGAAFRFHVLSLDPDASRLAKSVLREKRFYLDTNFLFRLLALHGPREAHAPAMIMEVAEELDCQVVVARATLEEFRSTIKYHAGRLRKHQLKREDFRRIAAAYAATDIDFMAQFYRELQSGKVKGIDEFEGKYLQIEKAVVEWGIEIDEDVTRDKDLLASLHERVEALYAWHGGHKPHVSCEHDALLEHHVREKRKSTEGGLNDIQVWFLTYDRRLTRFAYANPLDHEAPVHILAEDWLQIIRNFSPRTKDYSQAFVSLLASPLLVDDTAPPIGDVVSALNRLERYDGLSEVVVAGMVAEQEFLKRLNAATDPAEEKSIVELQVARIATALEARVKDVEATSKRLEFDRDRALVAGSESEQHAQSLAKELGEVKERVDNIEAQRDVALDDSDLVRAKNAELLNALRYGKLLLFGMTTVLAVFAVLEWWPLGFFDGGVRWHIFLVSTSATTLLLLAAGLWKQDELKTVGFWTALVWALQGLAELALR